MRFKKYLTEVYMSKSLGKDLDKSRSTKKNKFSVMVDGFEQESAPTKRGAESKRQSWIKWYIRNERVTRAEAEKAVTVEVNETVSVAGGAISNGYSGQTRAVGATAGEIIKLGNKPIKWNALLGIYEYEPDEEITEEINEKKSEFEILKQNKEKLTPEERAEVMKRKCVWHFAPNGGPTPAIWKSKTSGGETRYVCNTHRAYQSKPTLKGAIKAFEFIKTTA